jgi:hypothetical protein
MKYLVNRETKEHRIFYGTVPLYGEWIAVEADAEGWIKWDRGNKSPLPCHSKVELLDVNHFRQTGFASDFEWIAIKAYRPILDKPESVVKESLTTEKRHVKADGYVPPLQYDPRSVSFNVLKRLEAAHEAAQKIPDLEAELRDVLGRMGYDLVARDPFVEPIYESDMVDGAEGFTNTEPDMTDSRY